MDEDTKNPMKAENQKAYDWAGSTIRTFLHDKINYLEIAR